MGRIYNASKMYLKWILKSIREAGNRLHNEKYIVIDLNEDLLEEMGLHNFQHSRL